MPTYLVGPDKPYTTITAAIAAIPSNIAGTGVHEVVIDAGLYSEKIITNTIAGHSATSYISFSASAGSKHQFSKDHGVRISNQLQGATAGLYDRFYDIVFLVVAGGASAGDPKKDSAFYGSGFNLCVRCVVFTGIWGGFNGEQLAPCTYISCFVLASGGIVSFYYGYTYNCGVYNLGVVTSVFSFVFQNEARNCFVVNGSGGSGYEFYAFGSGALRYYNCAMVGSFWPPSCAVNSIEGITLSSVKFVDSSSFDFHILKTSILFNAGIDSSSILTEDIDGMPIEYWSIGPDSYSIELGGLFPRATIKPSHLRILREHRSPLTAQLFHERMKVAT